MTINSLWKFSGSAKQNDLLIGSERACRSHLGCSEGKAERKECNSLAITFTCCFRSATTLGMVHEVSCKHEVQVP